MLRAGASVEAQAQAGQTNQKARHTSQELKRNFKIIWVKGVGESQKFNDLIIIAIMNQYPFPLPALGLSWAPLLLAWASPGASQPYHFFPNTNPGIQRSLIIPNGGYGYGRTSHLDNHRIHQPQYGGQNNITIINNNSSCFKCQLRGNGRNYDQGNPYPYR